jgi:hypothetical protein
MIVCGGGDPRRRCSRYRSLLRHRLRNRAYAGGARRDGGGRGAPRRTPGRARGEAAGCLTALLYAGVGPGGAGRRARRAGRRGCAVGAPGRPGEQCGRSQAQADLAHRPGRCRGGDARQLPGRGGGHPGGPARDAVPGCGLHRQRVVHGGSHRASPGVALWRQQGRLGRLHRRPVERPAAFGDPRGKRHRGTDRHGDLGQAGGAAGLSRAQASAAGRGRRDPAGDRGSASSGDGAALEFLAAAGAGRAGAGTRAGAPGAAAHGSRAQSAARAGIRPTTRSRTAP